MDYHIVDLRVDSMPYAVYCCAHCQRAWRLAKPVDDWRLKTLSAHAATHKKITSEQLSVSTGREEGEPELPLGDPRENLPRKLADRLFPKKRRKKVRSGRKSKVA